MMQHKKGGLIAPLLLKDLEVKHNKKGEKMEKITIGMIEKQIEFFNRDYKIDICKWYNKPKLTWGHDGYGYCIYITCDRLLEHKRFITGTKRECYNVLYAMNEMQYYTK